MVFTDIMMEQMNNPQCSFLSGMVTGQIFTVKYLIAIFGLYIAFKLVQNLALDPLITWIKKKWEARKNV